MVATMEANIGRASLYLQSPNTEVAKTHLRNFISVVPADTHYFFQAHFELGRAIIMDQATQSPGDIRSRRHKVAMAA